MRAHDRTGPAHGRERPAMTGRFPDHFSTHAALYRSHRPGYPGELFDFLASLAPGRSVAVDCATGSGQAALALAERFGQVVASDASAEQLAHAPAHPHVRY